MNYYGMIIFSLIFYFTTFSHCSGNAKKGDRLEDFIGLPILTSREEVEELVGSPNIIAEISSIHLHFNDHALDGELKEVFDFIVSLKEIDTDEAQSTYRNYVMLMLYFHRVEIDRDLSDISYSQHWPSDYGFEDAEIYVYCSQADPQDGDHTGSIMLLIIDNDHVQVKSIIDPWINEQIILNLDKLEEDQNVEKVEDTEKQ